MKMIEIESEKDPINKICPLCNKEINETPYISEVMDKEGKTPFATKYVAYHVGCAVKAACPKTPEE
jgi:hypothetical protein